MALAVGTLELVVKAAEGMEVEDLRTGSASWRGREQLELKFLSPPSHIAIPYEWGHF